MKEPHPQAPARPAENRAEDRTLPGVHSALASVTPPRPHLRITAEENPRCYALYSLAASKHFDHKQQ